MNIYVKKFLKKSYTPVVLFIALQLSLNLISITLKAAEEKTQEDNTTEPDLDPIYKIAFSEDSSLTDDTLLYLLNRKEIQASLRELFLDNCTHLEDTSLKKIFLLRNLNALTLSRLEGFTEASLNAWEVAGLNESFSNNSFLFGVLYKIDLSHNPNLKCKKIVIFECMPYLTEINLAGLDYLEEIPCTVARCMQHVKTLNLSDCVHLKDLTHGAVALLTSLTKLDLSHCIHLSDEGLARLKNLVKLKELKLSECPNIDGSGLTALECPDLETLYLDSCSKIGSGANVLKKTTSSVDLRQKDSASISIYILKMKALTGISLNQCPNLNTKDLMALVRLPHLKKLCLAHCYRLDADILLLARALPKLELLNLCGAPHVSIKDLQKTLLSRENKLPKNLKILNLDACRQIKPSEVHFLRNHNPDRVITHSAVQGHESPRTRAYGPSPLATQSYVPPAGRDASLHP